MDGGFKPGRPGRGRGQGGDDDNGLTEAQNNLEQEKLFLEAREQFNQEREQEAKNAGTDQPGCDPNEVGPDGSAVHNLGS